jgi:hypothetical protein
VSISLIFQGCTPSAVLNCIFAVLAVSNWFLATTTKKAVLYAFYHSKQVLVIFKRIEW